MNSRTTPVDRIDKESSQADAMAARKSSVGMSDKNPNSGQGKVGGVGETSSDDTTKEITDSSCIVGNQYQSDSSDVDSRDEPTASPLHEADRADNKASRRKSATGMRPRLTLSAFRRPEHAIRLTMSDPSRILETYYDLHAPGCGVLGHGAFSTVRLAIRRRDGVKVAVKSIAKHEALRSRRLRIGGSSYLEEWEILRRFREHPYVITLFDVFETDDELNLVTEYCQGGELFDAIQKKRNRSHAMRRGQYSEMQASRITGQILRALADLHAQGIVHRDVKPENILLVGGGGEDADVNVKLCDFGIARPVARRNDTTGSDGDSSPLTPGRSRSYSTLGADYYSAPEVCYGGSYGTAVDIYSLGVTLYILLCGFPPVFSGVDQSEVVFPDSYWKDISTEAKDLVRKMLTSEPARRVTAYEALLDPWINVDGACNRRLDLSLVRSRLFDSMLARGAETNNNSNSEPVSNKRSYHETHSTPVRKRARAERRASSTLLALADLYRGVAASPSVSALTATSPKKERAASFAGSPVKFLSV